MDSRELTRAEKAAIRKLVISSCANYDSEYGCLPLDCDCYMLGKCWTGAYCRYFQNAVLSLDPVLIDSLSGNGKDRLCVVCKTPFYAANNRAKYCASCAEYTRLKRQRKYMQKSDTI